MDEKNAYIELVKQNRAKHRAKLKASKEIKKLEQKKEKVILKYEQAAKDNTCITFHQYCRKKWASEAGIESVPDDDETDVEWQEKLNAKQKEEDAWEDVPDVGNGLKRVNERLVARLRVILGTKFVNRDLRLRAKTSITAQNAAIGRSDGKVTFCDGGYSTALEGLQVFVFEDGKQITAYNWKIEDPQFQGVQAAPIHPEMPALA